MAINRQLILARLRYHFGRLFLSRRWLAAKYIRGEGYEIGASAVPVPVLPWVKVRYIDRASSETVEADQHHIPGEPFVHVDVVDDANTLATIPDASCHFIIANHVIEHCEDPIRTLGNWLRVVRPGGVVFFAVPDKRKTYDAPRPLTTVEHVVQDYTEGPGRAPDLHLVEWAEFEKASDVPARVAELREVRYLMHYHVWTDARFRELLEHCRTALKMPLRVEEIRPSGIEFVVILRKETGD